MANLNVSYLGLDLHSPIIVSSCSLTSDPAKVKEMQNAGAGAVVIKSLFEEQIRNEVEFLSSAGQSYPEMEDYLHAYVRSNSLGKYSGNIRNIKDSVTIPVIASINCYSQGEWVEYAKEIEGAGADALELNLYEQVTKPSMTSSEIEDSYLKIVRDIVSELKIPVSVKIGRHFTAIPGFVSRLSSAGAKGVVIFNRFFTPDIDLDNFNLVPAALLSHDNEYSEVLRWTAILSSAVRNMDISATTGIHSAETAIKMILAGASSVQICSVIYRNGISAITGFNDSISGFMEKNNIENLKDVCGRLSYASIPEPEMYERVQFMKSFGSYGK